MALAVHDVVRIGENTRCWACC